MTVSITYGQTAATTDCNDTTGWTKNEAGGLVVNLTVEIGDVFRINCAADSTDDEFGYYEKDITNLSGGLYTYAGVRWKTGDASGTVGVRASLIYSDASEDFIVGGTVPEFSTTWKTSWITPNPTKTIDKLRLYGDDYPDTFTGTPGLADIYFDFFMVCKGLFTFPYVSDNVAINFPRERGRLKAPHRDGYIIHDFGVGNPVITVKGNMDLSTTTWKSGQTTVGYALYDIMRSGDLWQWFEASRPNIKCKVNPVSLDLSANAPQADGTLATKLEVESRK